MGPDVSKDRADDSTEGIMLWTTLAVYGQATSPLQLHTYHYFYHRLMLMGLTAHRSCLSPCFSTLFNQLDVSLSVPLPGLMIFLILSH
jgi:hypothetical protein